MQGQSVELRYDHFAQLLDLKFSLLRSLHQRNPAQHAILKRAIAQIDAKLAGCAEYPSFIARYAQTRQEVG